MFIIFGSAPRFKTTGKGSFTCPNCGETRNYERKEVRQYLTLYFIPLIPVGSPREIIECMTCGRQFSAAVLDGAQKHKTQPATLAELLNGLGDRLREGQPLEYAVRDLAAAGLERDAAWRYVQAEAGSQRPTCTHCGLSYASGLTRCTVCDRPLETG